MRLVSLTSIVLLTAGLLAADEAIVSSRRHAALKPCDQSMDRGRRTEASGCYSRLLNSSASFLVRAEAAWALRDLHRANDLFREAVNLRPKDPYIRVRWGYLYLDTHSPAEAAKLFNEALSIDKDYPPAKLGAATVLANRFEGKAHDLVNEALKADPNLVEGYVLLAGMSIEEEDYEKAEEHIAKGLQVAEDLGDSPLEFYTLRASLDLLQGRKDSDWTRKALEQNPTYGKIYADQAHFYVISRRYREATELLRKAIAVDPELWSAHADLGVNLMRQGADKEGRKHFEIAYQGDAFNPKTTNWLRLLDSMKNFETSSNKDDVLLKTPEELEASVGKPEIILQLHGKEAAVLRPYVMELAEESIDLFMNKYGFHPKQPIRIEMYPDHDDFAVRTMGMPGLGLLGVTFGYVVAMDSPSGRPPGSFHWGTTLWHELAHVFTLEATEHLVPRWYSEGISMYEEWQARPGWGERVSTDFLAAMKEDKLLPIAELDKGFVRPRYRSQVAVSYFQAGLVCQLIADQWGFPKLVQLLEGFSEQITTAENIEAVLGVTAEEFDKRFEDYLQGEFGELIRRLPDFRKAMKKALAAAKAKNWDGVLEPATDALDIFPDFVQPANPYVVLATAHDELGDKVAAAKYLKDYQARGGKNPHYIRKLAKWLDDLGRRAEAIEALKGLIYVTPGEPDLHVQLGEWLIEEKRHAEAVREFRTHLLSEPLDLAGAHFNLARAYHMMGNAENTRKHLLSALEAAPSYRPAQKLLLEIVD